MNLKIDREPNPPTRKGHCPVHGVQDFVLVGNGAYVCPENHDNVVTRLGYHDETPGRSTMEGGRKKR